MINPIKRIKEKNNWTLQEMALICNISSSSVYKNLEGSYFNITNRILNTFKEMGYNTEKIKKEYAAFREAKRKEKLKQ